ncbi:MAG: c-type cytochrome [Gammaproteobacteria bacterium]
MKEVLNKALYLGLLAASFTMAEEPKVELKAGAGKSLVEANCGSCHSLDYIPMNSPILDRAGWEKSLKKMVDVMGAPVPERDLTNILDYLVQAYGK